MKSKDIRRQALEKLGPSFFQPALIYTLIYLALLHSAVLALSGSYLWIYSIVIVLAVIVAIAPISYALCDLYLRTYKGQPTQLSKVFSLLRGTDFFRALSLHIIRLMLTLLLLVVFIIPGIIFAHKTSMAMYLLKANPRMRVTDALKNSRKVMKGKVKSLFLLNLSLVPWLIVGVATLGLGFIVVSPYFYACKIVFYKRVVQGDSRVYDNEEDLGQTITSVLDATAPIAITAEQIQQNALSDEFERMIDNVQSEITQPNEPYEDVAEVEQEAAEQDAPEQEDADSSLQEQAAENDNESQGAQSQAIEANVQIDSSIQADEDNGTEPSEPQNEAESDEAENEPQNEAEHKEQQHLKAVFEPIVIENESEESKLKRIQDAAMAKLEAIRLEREKKRHEEEERARREAEALAAIELEKERLENERRAAELEAERLRLENERLAEERRIAEENAARAAEEERELRKKEAAARFAALKARAAERKNQETKE